MKRSVIYLKAAERLAPFLKINYSQNCGCALLRDIGDIQYSGGKIQVYRMKKYAPEYYLFRPEGKWDGESPFCVLNSSMEETEWRCNAFLFAHEIAKSNGQ